MPPLLATQHIVKRFPGVTALADVTFDLEPGEIHALCGENGAGKSTLLKLLGGWYPAGSYKGELRVDDAPAQFRSAADAEKAGIAVIWQELALVDGLTVAENLFLGVEPVRGFFIDSARMRREACDLLQRFGLKLNPDAPCGELGIAEKQLVEIVKALRKNSRILILDEPTAALAEHEVQTLMKILRDLRSRGIACIYVSHRLDEVLALADRITILRDGCTVATMQAAQATKAAIIRHMVGRELVDEAPLPADATATGTKPPLMEVQNLSVRDAATGRPRLHDISLCARPGEILGLAGLMGAGRTELLMHLAGAWGARSGGRVSVGGREMAQADPREAMRHGIALVSEDRRRYGLVLDQACHFNLSLSSLAAVTRHGFIDDGSERHRNDAQAQALQVRASSLDTQVGTLSGGNQQKIVLGRVLLTEPSIILLDEPTRGIDVGAKHEIWTLIRALAKAGKAVIVASSELPEILALSHRILVLREGRIAGEFPAGTAQETLMAAATKSAETATTASPLSP